MAGIIEVFVLAGAGLVVNRSSLLDAGKGARQPGSTSRRGGAGTQGWGTFLQNHFNKAVAIDFLVTYTSRFELFWVFLVLSLDRRKILHFNVTKNPTPQWTARQMIEAFPYASEPYEYVFRDRDEIYGMEFQNTLQVLGLK